MRKSNSKSLGQKIKRIREERKLLQVDLAAMAGISTGYVGSIEQGLRVPSIKTLSRIAKALKTPINSLL